jgi:transcription elongation factor GreA
MQKYKISKRIFETLAQHLIDIEQEKNYVIEKYYPIWTNERGEFQELLNSYLKSIENMIYNEVDVDDNATDACPLVIIGSQVLVKDLYTNKTEEIQIVSPFVGELDFSADCASYLSPMGRAFLLKKAKDEVMVETPMGIFYYNIEAIALPGEVFQFY